MPKRKSSLAIGQSRQKRYRQPTNVTEQSDIKGTDTWSDNDDPDQDESDENLLTIVRGALNNLRQVGKAFLLIRLLKMLATNRLPLANICFLLFLEIVTWFSLENTSTMRYSDATKRVLVDRKATLWGKIRTVYDRIQTQWYGRH